MSRISLHPVLVGPSSLEPVTLADIKDFLHLDAEEDNALLQTFIAAARLRVEATNGQLIMHQVWRFTLNAWPKDLFLVLPFHPVVEITQSRIFDSNGMPSALDFSGMSFDTQGRLPHLVLPASLPAPGRIFSGIEVDIKFGLSNDPDDITEDIKLAILELAAFWYENRAKGAETYEIVPKKVYALLQSARGKRL